jgi:anti-sigma regulatory factor (Ser/Thr protein kinase)
MPAAPPATCQPNQCARVIVANKHAPHAARSFIRHVFGDQAGDLLVVADELVSNAVEHAHGSLIAVSLRTVPDGVLVEVADQDRTPPRRRNATIFDDSGRGLAIVEALSVGWGWRPERRGKTVFAVVPDVLASYGGCRRGSRPGPVRNALT